MSMQVTLPLEALPAKIILNPELVMDDDEYFAFCQASPDVRFERTAEGEIIIVPPAGLESDFENVEVIAQLRNWAIADGRGQAVGSSAEFILPTRAAFSPDAAWVSNARLAQLTKAQRRKFPRLCPEFVVEVMSPSDRLKDAQHKMQEWIRGGVELGWLIHGDKRTVYIYRPGQAPEKQSGILKLAGEGPVAGFELDLTRIWDVLPGLR
jgi:Uma2 family endonuclease